MHPARLLAAALCFLLFSFAASAHSDAAPAQLFDEITERARELAASPHEPLEDPLPQALQEIGYDAYRSIRFRPEEALWREESLFSLQLLHSGFLFKQPIRLNLIEDTERRHLPFHNAFFRYDDAAASLAEHDLSGAGYSGFRLHYPLNNMRNLDEFVVFQGASYFRMVGRGQGYGLSARGLAIDTATDDGEEFPAFREFWLFKPEAEATSLTLIALLDSPSLAGAYRFTFHPGKQVVADVEARLFARQDVEKLGIAPLTSMFMFGDARSYPADDFRPQVHDSEGLLMQTHADEWIWRPLSNPPDLRISRLQDENPKGFGLAQRDRDFDQYLDLEARYERRPSLWVMPQEAWGRGSVELVEIPSDSETNDNIVAFWVPENPLRAGEERSFRYQLATFGAHRPEERLASVTRTRQGWAAIPGESDPPPRHHRRFIVDFKGGELSSLDASHPVSAELSISSGESHDLQVQQLPDAETWRATFRLQPHGETPTDMRLNLRLNGKPLTETWNYVWGSNELR